MKKRNLSLQQKDSHFRTHGLHSRTFKGDFLVLVVNSHKLPEMMNEIKGSAFFYPYNFYILHLNRTQSALKLFY